MEETGFRLSPQQRHLWSQLGAAGAAACATLGVVEIDGALDRARLAGALARLAARHESLRTRFRCRAGMKLPLQLIGEPQPPALAMVEGDGGDAGRGWQLAAEAPLRASLQALAGDRHRLVIALPALCCDGAGMDVALGELARLYAGDADRLGEALQYADVAEWSNELLTADETAVGRERWREVLRGLPPPGLLGGEAAAAPAAEAPAALRFRLAAPTGERLAALAGRLAVGPGALLLAVWQALLWRLAEGAGVSVGVAHDGRRHAELAGVVGLLARHLPVAVPPRGDWCLSELARRLEDEVAAAGRWQEAFSWEEGAEDGGAADAERCRFGFDYEPELAAREAAGAAFRTVERQSRFDRASARLVLRPGAGGALDGRLEAGAGWRQQAVADLVERFQTLLASALDAPGEPLARLALVGAGERRRLLVDFNRSAGRPASGAWAPPTAATVWQEIVAQAARDPERVAIAAAGSLTYGELVRRASGLAARLRRLGAGPEEVVGICLERGPEMVVAILGVLAAGGAYLPLDPAYPAARLRLMIEDSGARLLLADSRQAGGLAGMPAAVLAVDPAGLEPAPLAAPPAGSEPAGANLAYVIYTSGSTGRPKGVAVTHRSLALSTAARSVQYEAAPARFLLLPSFAFDSSVAGLFWTLATGGVLLLPGRGDERDPPALARLLAERGASHLLALPSLYELILAHAAPAALAPLRAAIVAGEACPAELVSRHAAHVPGAALFNEYGPTEGTVWSTVARCAAGDAVTIGVPIPGTRIYLVDGDLEPVPEGVAGELLVAGSGLARGYLGRPALTAERFLPDPFAGQPGVRLYRTGDLARHRPDGRLDLLGRLDQQVKIRGFRIELGEIEAVLLEHPAVASAAVTVAGEGVGHRLLAGFVPASGAPPPAAAELAAWLAGRLPAHMVPAELLGLAELPVLPNGKLDRRALAAAGEAIRAAAAVASGGPRTPIEEIVAAIWAEVLGRPAGEGVGRGDSFFALGGHSLLATRVVSRLRDAFGVEINLQHLFAAPTVEEMATTVGAALGAASPGSEPPLGRADRGGQLPLSFTQQRLWFLDRMQAGSSYNVPFALRLSGRLDRLALARALAAIVARHEVLRTTFPAVDGRPYQNISAASPEPLWVDLRRLPAAARQAAARHWVEVQAGRPFDLARGPLLRVVMLILDDSEHLATITVHHIVSDLWSLGIFVAELAEAYAAAARSNPPALPELPIQYGDFALWQRRWLDSPACLEQLAWWRRQLAGAPPVLELPADRPRPAGRAVLPGRRAAFMLAGELAAALREAAVAAGATLFMMLLAVFQLLLSRYSGQQDLVVGSPIAGRNRREIEGLIGCFVNTLVLRGDLAGRPSFRELLARTRAAALGAYVHQDLPFEKLVEALQPERDTAHTPLFQVLFALQNAHLPELRLGELELTPVEHEVGLTLFDLTLYMREQPAGLAAVIEADADLFEAATLARMAGHLTALLHAALSEPLQPAAELPMMAAAEREQVMAWSAVAPDAAAADGTPLHRRFSGRAAGWPDAVALSWGEQHCSYGELEARANRLARYLRRRGIGRGSLVGICLPRELEVVAAMLAVLKAGAAYVPLDPVHPAARLAFQISDSRLQAVVTRGELLASFALAADAAGPVPAFAVCSDVEAAAIAGEGATELEPGAGDVAAADVAYVIYTSGSTGRPKGVAVTHGNVTRLFDQTAAWFELAAQPPHVWTLLHSYAFDFSVWEIWGALLYGGRLVVVPQWLSRSPEDLLRLLVAEGVTVLSQTPSAFHQLQQTALRQRTSAGGLPLRWVVFGGEALDSSSLAPWWRDVASPGTAGPRLANLYGITETTVHATLREVAAEPPGPARIGSPIGRPIPDLGIHVVDRWQGLAPIGVPGELCIAGAGLATGYLRRPELTAERFLPHPWSAEPGQRLYRSGDLGRWLPAGELEYLGRIDQQVKIRGYRIELGEVEAVLALHPAVERAAVRLHEAGGDRRLAAYLAAAAAPPPGDPAAVVPAVRAFAQERLPDYMVPAFWVVLDRLPLTANGKVDRRALPPPEGGREGSGSGWMAPRTEMEAALAAIWEELLGIERIGIEDNFFDLGGHSLLATQAMARVQQALGVEVPLRLLFDHPTVAAMAAAIERDHPVDANARELAALLDQLEGLSDEEVRSALERGR